MRNVRHAAPVQPFARRETSGWLTENLSGNTTANSAAGVFISVRQKQSRQVPALLPDSDTIILRSE